jgi:hypothetical protein
VGNHIVVCALLGPLPKVFLEKSNSVDAPDHEHASNLVPPNSYFQGHHSAGSNQGSSFLRTIDLRKPHFGIFVFLYIKGAAQEIARQNKAPLAPVAC